MDKFEIKFTNSHKYVYCMRLGSFTLYYMCLFVTYLNTFSFDKHIKICPEHKVRCRDLIFFPGLGYSPGYIFIPTLATEIYVQRPNMGAENRNFLKLLKTMVVRPLWFRLGLLSIRKKNDGVTAPKERCENEHSK